MAEVDPNEAAINKVHAGHLEKLCATFFEAMLTLEEPSAREGAEQRFVKGIGRVSEIQKRAKDLIRPV